MEGYCPWKTVANDTRRCRQAVKVASLDVLWVKEITLSIRFATENLIYNVNSLDELRWLEKRSRGPKRVRIWFVVFCLAVLESFKRYSCRLVYFNLREHFCLSLCCYKRRW
jgi:hypothetical protein